MISAFQTKKGAVVYSLGGSVNCDERVAKSGTLTSLMGTFLQEYKEVIQILKVKMNLITDDFISR